MKTVGLLLFLILFQSSGQDSFIIPGHVKGLPVTYLKDLSVNDTSRQLSETERKQLVRLFTWAYVNSVRKAGQDYALPAQSPIYKLLKSNFPSVATQEGEGGIMLGKITRFFNRIPEYESIVDSELEKRENGITSCKD